MLAASTTTKAAMPKKLSAIRRTARRSARSLATWSAVWRISRHAITTALATSTTESSPKPTNAMEPASRPPAMAIRASTLFQAMVAEVNHHAHRRACGSVLPATGVSQSHVSPQGSVANAGSSRGSISVVM